MDSGKMPHLLCRFCKSQPASSREHLISFSRLNDIKKYKNRISVNDNVRKAFKGITCTRCNNFLGELERKKFSLLAYSTVWKVLAGNYNNVFTDTNLIEFLVKHSSPQTIEQYERLFEYTLRNSSVLPNYTFSIFLGQANQDVEGDYSLATQEFQFILTDQTGAPADCIVSLEGNKFLETQAVETNDAGIASLSLLLQIERVKVCLMHVGVANKKTCEKFDLNVDCVVYISYGNTKPKHSIMVILPLIPQMESNWCVETLELNPNSVITFLNSNFPELNIKNIWPYFR